MKDIYSIRTFMRMTAYFLGFALTFSAVLVLCSLPNEPDSGIIASAIGEADGESKLPTVIIDAGHGGIDGGATVEGISEKDINLTIALRLYELCRVTGIPCVLTRSDDSLLYTEEAHKKAQDLKNRLAVTQSYDNCILISIHQNKFPQKSCRGLQVYYSKNHPDSQRLALSVQQTVVKYIQQENKRLIKPADSAIYLLDRAAVAAVLVECGFLSNDAEREALQTAEYQSSLCIAFLAAITYFTSDG